MTRLGRAQAKSSDVKVTSYIPRCPCEHEMSFALL